MRCWRWGFQRLDRKAQDRHRLRVLTLTADEIEAALRTAALRAAGLDDASFPALTIAFQRTLRIPDGGRTYPLPAGLGAFPLRSVDDFPATAPATWLQRGGVVPPMDQSEALWISFPARYPCAVKIAAGKINAVSGAAWTAELRSEPQDYVVLPGQPWLDGFSVGEGLIRQFQAPVRRSLLARALLSDYPFPMPAAVRREFTLQALDGALEAAARQVRESLTKKGLPRYVLEDGVLIRIAPDGTRRPMRRTSAVAKRAPKPGRRGH